MYAHLMRSAVVIVCFAWGGIALGQNAQSPTGDTAKKPDESRIGIRVKVFDADRPAVPLTPLAAFGYYRPGEGLEPLFLDDLKFEAQDKGFYQVTVPKSILLERLVITVAERNYNPAVLTKIVTANEMVVYLGASDSQGVFSFQGYKGQLQTYAALYAELVEDLRLASQGQLREMFGSKILAMPEADDLVRLPGLDARQRDVARRVRTEVLRLFGYLPPEVGSGGQQKCVSANRCRLAKRCLFGLRLRH